MSMSAMSYSLSQLCPVDLHLRNRRPCAQANTVKTKKKVARIVPETV